MMLYTTICIQLFMISIIYYKFIIMYFVFHWKTRGNPEVIFSQ